MNVRRQVVPLQTFFAIFVAVLVLLFLCWGVLVRRGYYPHKPDSESEWIAQILEKKRSVRSGGQPRVLFAGGSATLFGVSALRATQELGIGCVNLGSHAGLGLSFILDEALSVAKSGDFMVVCVEYDLWHKDHRPTQTLVTYLLGCSWSEMMRARLEAIVGSFLAPSLVDLVTLLSSSSDPAKVSELTPPTDYRAETLNEFGDETHNPASERREAIDLYEFYPEAEVNSRVAQQFADFFRTAKKRNITVVACHPPRLVEPEILAMSEIPFFKRIHEYCNQVKVPMLCKPDLRGSPEDFFDTPYHLNHEAAEKFTLKICSALGSESSFLAWRSAAAGERVSRIADYAPGASGAHVGSNVK